MSEVLPPDFLDCLRHAADEDEAAGQHLQADYIRQAAAEIERLRATADRRVADMREAAARWHEAEAKRCRGDCRYPEVDVHLRSAAAIRALPDAPEPQGWRGMDDLAMLIRKLVHRLRKHEPDSEMAERAMDYLARHSLQGSPFRADEEPPPSARTAQDDGATP